MAYGKSTLVVSSLTLMSLLKLPGVAKKTLSPALIKNEQIKLYRCSLAKGFHHAKRKCLVTADSDSEALKALHNCLVTLSKT